MDYFIGDLHVSHYNSIRFDSRPWDNIEDMDTGLIERWNNQVKPEDTVYILGDLSWRDNQGTVELLKQLNGEKVLIVGNHDKFVRDPVARKYFKEITPYKEILYDGTWVILCHYPIMCWKNRMRNTIHLYAHVHNTETYDLVKEYKQKQLSNNVPCRMFNVGCMMPYMNYTPQTLNTILEYCEEK